MEITDVRVRLVKDPTDRLKAFCSVTFDGEFVVRDVKVVEGTNGFFVAMPSRKVTSACPKCHHKNQMKAGYCEECGTRLPHREVPVDANGQAKLYRDVAHPITQEFREKLQQLVVEAYRSALEEQPMDEPIEEGERDTGFGAEASETSDVATAEVESTNVEATDVETADVETTDVETADVESAEVEPSNVEASETSDVEEFDDAIDADSVEPLETSVDGQADSEGQTGGYASLIADLKGGGGDRSSRDGGSRGQSRSGDDRGGRSRRGGRREDAGRSDRKEDGGRGDRGKRAERQERDPKPKAPRPEKVEALAAPAGFGAGLTSESVEDTRPPVVEEAEKAVSASTGGGTCDASSAVANDEPAASDGGPVGFGAGIS